jgi:tyrosyl-tRNA synthetase
MKPHDPIAILKRGVVDLVQAEDLEKRLASGRPLRVKAGFDPTRPDLHLGHTVLLQKMRQFQELGHTVIFLVGDATAMVGDPTGQNEQRPHLSHEEVMDAAATYQVQAFKVLDRGKTEVRYNSEWLFKFSPLEFLELSAKMTVARMLERDDFAKRYAARRPIHLHEFLYPLLQAYDSVALDADVELGGTDQLFNLMAGRDMMPRYGKQSQIVMTVPLLEGTDARVEDGEIVGAKMSKSKDNYIGVTEEPIVMFRKVMQIDDAVVWRYFELLSSRSADDIAALKSDVIAGRSPLEIKALFATEIIGRFHSAEAAIEAQREFEETYRRHGVPDQVPEIRVPTQGPTLWIAKALSLAGLVKTTSEGKRLVEQGGVEVDGERIGDPQFQLATGGPYLIRAGSKNRRFAKVIVEPAAS